MYDEARTTHVIEAIRILREKRFNHFTPSRGDHVFTLAGRSRLKQFHDSPRKIFNPTRNVIATNINQFADLFAIRHVARHEEKRREKRRRKNKRECKKREREGARG